MKNMKKILALVVAALMIAASMSAFAVANEKTIKVEGLAAGDTIKYTQVIAWDNTNGWVKATGFTSLADAVFNEVVGTTTTAGKITDASATAIAALATSMTDGGSVAAGTTSWEKSNMAPGLYMVQAVSTSADVIYNPVFVAVQADGTGGVVTLPLNYADNGTAKKSTVTLDKTASKDGGTTWGEWTTQDVGDIIDYKIETTVPAYLESYTNPIFWITDTLTDGLTFQLTDSAKTTITLSDSKGTLATPADYTVDTLEADNFKISLTKDYLQKHTAATVVTVRYQAKITDKAKNVNPETNTAKIEYSRNPSDGNDHGTKEDKTTHYTFSIDAGLQGDSEYTTSEIIKIGVDENGNPILDEKEYSNKETHKPLKGAKFALFGPNSDSTRYVNADAGIAADTVFTSDDWGRMEINGLDAGTYYLKEVEAAPGYMLLTDYLKFVITATEKVVPATETCNAYKELDTYDVKVYHVKADGTESLSATSHYTLDQGTIKKTDEKAGDVGTEVKNTNGTSLPSTGGMGTTILYVGGSILVILAAVLLITKRRMSADE